MRMIKTQYKSVFPVLLVCIFGVLESKPAYAAESGPTPILVELFTSEAARLLMPSSKCWTVNSRCRERS